MPSSFVGFYRLMLSSVHLGLAATYAFRAIDYYIASWCQNVQLERNFKKALLCLAFNFFASTWKFLLRSDINAYQGKAGLKAA
jgi:hypothetical protein